MSGVGGRVGSRREADGSIPRSHEPDGFVLYLGALGLDPVGNPTDAQGSASVDTGPTPPTPPSPPTPPPSAPSSNSRGSGTGGSDAGAGGSPSGDTGSKGPAVSEFGVNADGIGNATNDDRFVINLAASHAPPAASGSEFDFSTTDIGRLGALGLVGVAVGWFVIAAGRRRRDEEAERYDGFAPGPATLTAASASAAAVASAATRVAPLYLDRRQRRERRKLRNRLFHRDPSVDRRTEKRRRRRR